MDMQDIISAFIYSWDESKDLNFLLVNNKKTDRLILPRKDTGVDVSGSLSQQQASRRKHSPFSIEETINELVSSALDVNIKCRSCLLHLLRVYIPSQQNHISHAIYGIFVNFNEFSKIKLNSGCSIHNFRNISKIQHQFEQSFFFNLIHDIQQIPQTKPNDQIIFPGAKIKEILPQCINDIDDNLSELFSSLLSASGYTETDLEILYEAFTACSFPYDKVTSKSMKFLLKRLGWNGREEQLFRALDIQGLGELTLGGFLLGLIALDPLTQHGNEAGEFRCRLIFRFYDKDNDNYLNENEMTSMMKDINLSHGQLLSPEELQASVQNAFKIFGVSVPHGVSSKAFLTCVGSLKFRGTSSLLRASSSIPIILSLKKNSKSHPLSDAADGARNNKRFKSGVEKGLSVPSQGEFLDSPTCSYTLAEHTVGIRKSGTITNITHLLDMELAGVVCHTGLDADERISKGKKSPRFLKQFSAQAFNAKSLPNEILSSLKYFECEAKMKRGLTWGPVDMGCLAKYISATCEALVDILDGQPRLLDISTPCYILGDLHGNFSDLMCFEKALWKLGPHLTPASFLFLGDYVDRGQHGVEVVLYLFAQKLLSPNRFHLLRGNHEVRGIQKIFSFYNECINKFGEVTGNIVWEDINKVFDRMPIAAVVDKKIFCIHGGIPKLTGNLNDINQIPCPLKDPESESNIAWQILWNDPIGVDDLSEDVVKQLAENDGFADNIKRQTAFVFNEKAFKNFLKKHSLTHVIRAHEVKAAGFEIQQSGSLLTVFSSSEYCGGSNEAACVLVHDFRIRIIRIDTS